MIVLNVEPKSKNNIWYACMSSLRPGGWGQDGEQRRWHPLWTCLTCMQTEAGHGGRKRVIITELEGLLWYEYNGYGLETHWEILKTSKSSPTQFLKTRRGILSCPAALRALILERILFTLPGAKQQCLCLPQCYCSAHSPTTSPAFFHKD